MELFNTFVWITDGMAGLIGLIFIFNARVANYIEDIVVYTPPFRLWQLGAVICSLGMIAQSFWSWGYITAGRSPGSYYWYMKDLGIMMMGGAVVWYTLYIYRELKKLRG